MIILILVGDPWSISILKWMRTHYSVFSDQDPDMAVVDKFEQKIIYIGDASHSYNDILEMESQFSVV